MVQTKAHFEKKFSQNLLIVEMEQGQTQTTRRIYMKNFGLDISVVFYIRS